MAKLPSPYDLGRVRPGAPRPIAQINPSAGTAVGRAMEGMGNTVADIGFKIQDREDTAAAKERDAYVSDEIRKILYDPEAGFTSMHGKNAVAARGDALKRLEQLQEQAVNGLSNGAQRKLDTRLTSRIDSAMQTIDTHTSAQRNVWMDSASKGRIAAAEQDALLGAVDDAYGIIAEELTQKATREGWSQAELDFELAKSKSSLFYNQAVKMADQNPTGALDFVEQNSDKFLPKQALELRQTLEPLAKEQRGREFGRRLAMGIDTTLSGDMALYADAIANIESKGSGDYSAVGPVVKGDRAYGKYQVMGVNIGPWTKRWLGREMTPQEFLADPAAQDAVFAGQFGSYVEKYENPVTAARAWFGFGESDGYTSGSEYERRFSNYVSTHAAPARTASLGMIGGVKSDAEVWQSLDASGKAHAENPNYEDYSQLFREYRFDPPDDTWVAVGERDGKTVYAAPDYARDEDGNYISVSAAEAQRLAQERGSVLPTRDEVKALYGKAHRVKMPTSSDFGKDGGEGTPQEYTMHVRARMSENGLIEGRDPVVHGKEFFAEEGVEQTSMSDMDRILAVQDPVERKAAMAEYELRVGVRANQRKTQIDAATNEAFKFLESGGSPDDLPLDIRQTLGMEAMGKLRTYHGKKESGDPIETNPSTYLELKQLQADNPDEFRTLNMIDYVDQLSETDWQGFVDAQNKPVDETTRTAASTLMTVAKRQMESAGIDTTPEPGSKDASRNAAMQARLLRWQEQFVGENKRQPTQAEIDERIGTELIPVVLDPPGLFNKGEGFVFDVPDVEPEELAETGITIGDVEVPPAVVREQVAAIEAEGGSVTSEILVQRLADLIGGRE